VLKQIEAVFTKRLLTESLSITVRPALHVTGMAAEFHTFGSNVISWRKYSTLWRPWRSIETHRTLNLCIMLLGATLQDAITEVEFTEWFDIALANADVKRICRYRKLTPALVHEVGTLIGVL
jgi:hypothetical protein